MNFELFTPELSLVFFTILLVLLSLFIQRKGIVAALGIIGILVAGGFAIDLWGGNAESTFYNMLVVDNFAIFFKVLFLGIGALVILASVDYIAKRSRFHGEYFALILTSVLGMMLMAATTELISIYIALELTSISLYILVGYLKDEKSNEASIKYLLLGATASAVLLFGMALVFGFTGKTQLAEIAQVIQGMSLDTLRSSPALVMGVILLIAGFGFKIAAVPFHMWVPDVYEGAPTPITAYLSVGSKAAGFAVILRVFYSAFESPNSLASGWGLVFAVLAAIGMTLGNVAAIPQTNIKRMLGYSSIAQAGYIMVGLATVGVSSSVFILGRSGILFFLAAYALTNMGAFIAIIAITNKLNSDLIADFSGVGKRSPLLALGLTLCLVSLVGMPPAAGFIAKFYIFSAAVKQSLLWLVIVAVVNSVISAYYYLRVVKVMWFDQPRSDEKLPSSPALRVAMAISVIGVLALGIVPGQIMKLAELAARIFVS